MQSPADGKGSIDTSNVPPHQQEEITHDIHVLFNNTITGRGGGGAGAGGRLEGPIIEATKSLGSTSSEDGSASGEVGNVGRPAEIHRNRPHHFRKDGTRDDDASSNRNSPFMFWKLVWFLTKEFSPKLVLEVFGAAGAIWGFSEVLDLRRPETIWFWRPAAISVGCIFFLRFLHQVSLAIDIFYGTSKFAVESPRSFDLELGESNFAFQLRLAHSNDPGSMPGDTNIEAMLSGENEAVTDRRWKIKSNRNSNNPNPRFHDFA